MASPQTAHGYTKVANSLMRALCRFPFSGQELRLLVWVLRDSYGWGEKWTHPAPLSRIEEETGIGPSTSSWAIKKLVERGVIVRAKQRRLRFNKNYDEWLVSQPGMLPLSAAPRKPADDEPDDKPRAGAKFTPPTLEQVRAYCASRKSGVDADKFWHHYESTSWMSGRSKMTNWKSKVCFWERTDDKGKGKLAGGKPCPLCERPITTTNAVVCDTCGPKCRKCGHQTARLVIRTRADGTKTAWCHECVENAKS